MAKNYYNSKIVYSDYIRESGYSRSLVRSGFVKVGNKYYYCDKNAKIVKDKIVTYDDKDYYFDKDGVLVVNAKNFNINDDFYDIDKNGELIKVNHNK